MKKFLICTKLIPNLKSIGTKYKQGGDRIHLTFTGCCPRRRCKVLEAGQVQATGQNEAKAIGGENEDGATMGGEN
jgi:hypothetical protein